MLRAFETAESLDVDILPGEKYSCVPTARFQTLSA
jgi:hypothetical protein